MVEEIGGLLDAAGGVARHRGEGELDACLPDLLGDALRPLGEEAGGVALLRVRRRPLGDDAGERGEEAGAFRLALAEAARRAAVAGGAGGDCADEARTAIRDARDQKGGTQGKRVPAEAADIVAGRDVRDKRGKGIGLVESVEPDGAVVATELGRVKVPLEAFGKDGKGLMLDLIKADFDRLVAEATAAG